ncbi:MAG: patatin-like phospholipase family protein, partial [Nitrososphaeraceae archaeon]
KVIENALILQGGGSLGAFGCGVFKAIANKKIKLDIIAGTSIGGVNAAIMAGSKDEKHPEQALEQFWLEISESFVDLDENSISSSDYLSKGIQELLRSSSGYYYNYDLLKDLSNQEKKQNPSVTMDENEYVVKMKQLRSFYSSAFFGNEKMFQP